MTFPALASLLVGRTLADRYEVEELIGRGGMSLVYRARDLRLRRPVAVKIISIPAAEERDQAMLRERLRREAAAAARVPPHPNVMQVYDYGTDAALDLDFIAMELLRGRTLREILREGTLDRGEAVRIALEAARGLAAGHRAGIIHRDVKPPNIMLTDDDPPGNVRLLDFGIAISTGVDSDDAITGPGHTPHSPAYASPEQREPGQPVGAASDVYQLALVTREMLIGSRQVDGPAAEAKWMALPPGLREVLQRTLHEVPEQRYPDAAAFAEAFSAAALAWGDEAAPRAGEVGGESAPAEGYAGLHSSDSAPHAEASHPVGPEPTPVEDVKPVQPGTRRGLLSRALAGTGIVLAALVTLRLLTVAVETTDETPAPLAPNVEALDDAFDELMRQAGENVRLGAESLPAEFR